MLQFGKVADVHGPKEQHGSSGKPYETIRGHGHFTVKTSGQLKDAIDAMVTWWMKAVYDKCGECNVMEHYVTPQITVSFSTPWSSAIAARSASA